MLTGQNERINRQVLLCGSTSQHTQEEIRGSDNDIWLSTMRVCLPHYVIFSYVAQYEEARTQMAGWIKHGKLKIPSFAVSGDVCDFPEAFKQLYEGKNLGKMVLKLPAAI